MCTENQLKVILDRVAATARTALGDRLRGAYLYGSYARGDYDAESDVDILVLADVPREKLAAYKKPFLKATSDLGLEYDVVVTVTLKDTDTFEKYLDAVPFYQNVRKEGVPLAGKVKKKRTERKERLKRLRFKLSWA